MRGQPLNDEPMHPVLAELPVFAPDAELWSRIAAAHAMSRQPSDLAAMAGARSVRGRLAACGRRRAEVAATERPCTTARLRKARANRGRSNTNGSRCRLQARGRRRVLRVCT